MKKLLSVLLTILISLAVVLPAHSVGKDKLIKKACELIAKKKPTLSGKAKKLFIKKCIAKKKKAAKSVAPMTKRVLNKIGENCLQ